jgi:D-lactate dehydrogenase
MKIAFFEIEPFEKDFFTKQFPNHELFFSQKPLSSRTAKKFVDVDIIAVFTFSRIDKIILDNLPKLSCIVTMSTGYDHIDLVEAKKRNISVCNVPEYGQNTVAEYAFGLLQTLNRNIIPAVFKTQKKDFNYKGLIGSDLEGKTLGVLGAGKIGKHMIRYAKAFNMNILVYDLYAPKCLAKELGFTYSTLPNLCKHSDVISLHLPLLSETRHILGSKEISLMKKNVLIINTSRGALIDTRALISALDKKRIAGCALDVLEYECDMKKESRFVLSKDSNKRRLHIALDNDDLLFRDNVIITPHLAFYTYEALERIAKITSSNIKGALRKRFINKVS